MMSRRRASQVIGEGWAAPLTGFMREGPLLQSLHFNSLLIDPANNTGAVALNTQPTDWNDYFTRGKERVSSAVPIVLPATGFTKAEIETSGKKAAALVDKDGKTWGVIRNPEIYANRKEEIVSRCFGVIDPGHPYIEHIYKGGDWLIGASLFVVVANAAASSPSRRVAPGCASGSSAGQREIDRDCGKNREWVQRAGCQWWPQFHTQKTVCALSFRLENQPPPLFSRRR